MWAELDAIEARATRATRAEAKAAKRGSDVVVHHQPDVSELRSSKDLDSDITGKHKDQLALVSFCGRAGRLCCALAASAS
jgi:hypothetical protein